MGGIVSYERDTPLPDGYPSASCGYPVRSKSFMCGQSLQDAPIFKDNDGDCFWPCPFEFEFADEMLQGYLAHKKPPHPRILQWAYA